MMITNNLYMKELTYDELLESNGGSNVVNGITGASLAVGGMAALRGAKNGASIGRFGGPWGLIGGAVAGAVVGVYLGNK